MVNDQFGHTKAELESEGLILVGRGIVLIMCAAASGNRRAGVGLVAVFEIMS